MILSDEELAAFTKRRRKDAQLRVLRFMGIEHKIRPDGSLVVLRAHVEREMGGVVEPRAREFEPDWSGM